MANSEQLFSSDQPDFFERLNHDPLEEAERLDLDVYHDFIAAVVKCRKMAKQRGLSVDLIVERMNQRLPELEKPLTKRQLYSWTAGSKEYSEFPARFLPAFCVVCRCDLPLRVMANTINLELVDQRDLLAKELGQLELNRAADSRRAKQIKSQLGD